ncbi:RiPP maturation radical SAM C-methyltransferase [Streptomyces sp. NPDC091376]|uniref:RiPP maturation radical SAM C-methyltransferase n=1 Tax=Streptomyces sp. NPDC091376 TaxID=3365994 RepID=UPI0038222AB1
MKVLLANMPWAPVDLPSLALGILKTSVNEYGPGSEAQVLHANLDYIDWICSKTDFDSNDYEYYSFYSYFLGIGDWVFSSALYGDPGWRVEEFKKEMAGELEAGLVEKTLQLHALAPEFVRHISEKIVASQPDVVGLTAMFQQVTAALAVARYVKEIDPRIRTVLGGPSFDAEQGAATHRNFPFVDYVVRGEGEVAFPQLLDVVAGNRSPEVIGSLCWRDSSGRSIANSIPVGPLPPSALLPPDFDGYTDRLDASAARSWGSPCLVLEGSRGCWWGEKHQCTFCGLNGSFMQFRSKAGETFYTQIVDQLRRHRILDVSIVDNILDMQYFGSLLPLIIDSEYDVRFHVEVKSNLRSHQLRLLSDAGMTFVQPGIESLSSRVLRLMDKGVTGCQNVRTLRDGQTAGLSIAWNYLHGFAGEESLDYDSVVDQLPVLHHLEPPMGQSGRITIERFSPYFEKPELGFFPLRPAKSYRATYDLPENELFDLAYVFDAPNRGIGSDVVDRLNAGLQEWIDAYPSSRLVSVDFGDRIVLINGRRSFPWSEYEVKDPLELAVFRLLEQPRTIEVLKRKAREELPSMELVDARVRSCIARWQELGIIFEDDGMYIHVVPEANNQELLKLNCLERESAASETSRTESRNHRPTRNAAKPVKERTGAGSPMTVSCWRDYSVVSRSLKGMSLGDVEISGPSAASAVFLWEKGARCVRMPEPISFTPEEGAPDSVYALDLVRDFTSLGMCVEWEVSLGEEAPPWQTLSHLYPPGAMEGIENAEETLEVWRSEYYLGRCAWMKGPGFIQIRDRRWGGLNRFILTDPHEVGAIETFDVQDTAVEVPQSFTESLTAEHLVIKIADRAWFAPYRMRRRPQHAW